MDEKEQDQKMLDVTYVMDIGNSALWEYAVSLPGKENKVSRRVLLPANIIPTDGRLPLDTIAEGLEVGERWEELFKSSLTPVRVANELHRHGIWTADDLRDQYIAAQKIITRIVIGDFALMFSKLK